MKILKNSRELGNEIYINVLRNIFEVLRCVDNFEKIYVHKDFSSVDSDDIEGLDESEVQAILMTDALEHVAINEVTTVTSKITHRMYLTGPTLDLLVSELELFKTWYKQVNNKLMHDMSVEASGSLVEIIKPMKANIVYSLIQCFQLYYGETGYGAQNCVIEYCANYGLVVEDLCSKFMEYFRENRPTLPLFIRYPEFSEMLDRTVDDAYIFQLLEYSDYITADEIENIRDGNIIVDELYLDELKTRANIEDFGEGDN